MKTTDIIETKQDTQRSKKLKPSDLAGPVKSLRPQKSMMRIKSLKPKRLQTTSRVKVLNK